MFQIVFGLVGTALVCSLGAAHAAQSAHDPADPAAPTPAFSRPSAFQDYHPFTDPTRVSWDALMQEIAPFGAPAIGHTGHGAHADDSRVQPPSAPAKPEPGHSHHQSGEATHALPPK